MLALASRLRPIWPLLALMASAAMLAAAHAFQRFGGLQPCPLCLDQREWHWAVIGVAAASLALLRLKPGLARWTAAALGIVFLASFGMIPIAGLAVWPAGGAYHVAVEQHWVVAQCDARIDLGDIRPLDFEGEVRAPACDEIAWSMFGISMAGYNALISLALALASFAIAFLPERKP